MPGLTLGPIVAQSERFSVHRGTYKGRVIAAKCARSSVGLKALREEAHLLRKLCHPGVPEYVDWLEASSCLVTEWIAGLNSAVVVARSGGIPSRAALDWTAQLADVLATLHAQRVAHRDIVPRNIMVQPSGVGRLIDFGEAVSPWTGVREGGTWPYMSPERWGRSAWWWESAWGAEDVYGLGCCLYEWVRGVRLMNGMSPSQLADLMSSRATHDAFVTERVHGLPVSVAEVVVGCTRFVPSKRLSVSELKSRSDRDHSALWCAINIPKE